LTLERLSGLDTHPIYSSQRENAPPKRGTYIMPQPRCGNLRKRCFPAPAIGSTAAQFPLSSSSRPGPTGGSAWVLRSTVGYAAKLTVNGDRMQNA
jgi:hypothetical protein